MDGVAVDQKQPFSEHLKELRKRLGLTALAFFLGSAVGYLFRTPIVEWLTRPQHGPLYYDTPAGNFNLIMQICMLAGVCACLPVVMYNLIRFVEPAVRKNIRSRYLRSLTGMSLVLAVAGVAFAYWVALPMSLHFFAGFKLAGISPLISASSYLSFVIKCILTFMVVFQLPLMVLFVDFIRPLPPRQMIKYEKYVIVASLIIALVLPFTYDPLTQFVIAVPIILLYNISLLLVVVVHFRRRRQASAHLAPLPKPVVLPRHLRRQAAWSQRQTVHEVLTKPLETPKLAVAQLKPTTVAPTPRPVSTVAKPSASRPRPGRLISDMLAPTSSPGPTQLVLKTR